MNNDFIAEQFLAEFKSNASLHYFKPRQSIYYKGHLPYGLYFLMQGKVIIENSKNNVDKINILINNLIILFI